MNVNVIDGCFSFGYGSATFKTNLVNVIDIDYDLFCSFTTDSLQNIKTKDLVHCIQVSILLLYLEIESWNRCHISVSVQDNGGSHKILFAGKVVTSYSTVHATLALCTSGPLVKCVIQDR